MLGQRARHVLGDRRDDVARTIGVQLRAQRDRAAAEVAAQPRAAAHELVGRQPAAGPQILEERAAQVLLDLVARLLDRDLGQRRDGREMQVLGGLGGGRGRALEHEHRADGLVARRDRDLGGEAARRVRRAVLHEVGDVAPQLGQALGRRLPGGAMTAVPSRGMTIATDPPTASAASSATRSRPSPASTASTIRRCSPLSRSTRVAAVGAATLDPLP